MPAFERGLKGSYIAAVAWVQARKSDQKSWLNHGRCILNAFGFLDISGVRDLTGDTFES